MKYKILFSNLPPSDADVVILRPAEDAEGWR